MALRWLVKYLLSIFTADCLQHSIQTKGFRNYIEKLHSKLIAGCTILCSCIITHYHKYFQCQQLTCHLCEHVSREVVQMPPALNLEHANLNIFIEEYAPRLPLRGMFVFNIKDVLLSLGYRSRLMFMNCHIQQLQLKMLTFYFHVCRNLET